MEISAEVLRMVLYGRLERDVDDLLRRRQIMQDRQTVPGAVCILPSTIPGATWGVFCTAPIKQGSEMGPYTGTTFCQYPHVCLSPTAWELLTTDGSIAAYIEGGSRSDNWLACVQCARTEAEQNLEVDQIGNQIYYRATKDIRRGDELLVWYGKSYGLYMGVPYLRQVQTLRPASVIKQNSSKDQDKLVRDNIEVVGETKWRCVLCQRGFNSRSNLRSHMRIHTLEKPFACKFCGRKFSQSSTLRNHVRLHTGEKPYKCTVCKSSYSQLAGLRAHQRSSTHKPSGSTHKFGRSTHKPNSATYKTNEPTHKTGDVSHNRQIHGVVCRIGDERTEVI